MQDKIAVHVPNKWLSKAVQEYLFSKGHLWFTRGKAVIEDCEGKCITVNRPLGFADEFMSYETKSFYLGRGYTILTVDEFFALEEEAKEVWPRLLTLELVEVTATKSRVILLSREDSETITVTWPELDQIGALRPKEGE